MNAQRAKARARIAAALMLLDPPTMTTDDLQLLADALETALAKMTGPLAVLPGGAA